MSLFFAVADVDVCLMLSSRLAQGRSGSWRSRSLSGTSSPRSASRSSTTLLLRAMPRPLTKGPGHSLNSVTSMVRRFSASGMLSWCQGVLGDARFGWHSVEETI